MSANHNFVKLLNGKIVVNNFQNSARKLILDHFLAYGKIRLIKFFLHKENSRRNFAFVVFWECEIVEKVLSAGLKQFLADGCEIDIMPATQWKIPKDCSTEMLNDVRKDDHPLKRQLDVDNYLTRLNDDCLLKIFQCIDVFALIALRQMNNRFIALVDYVISRRKQEDFVPFLLKSKTLYFDLIKNRTISRRLTLRDTEAILKCVGKFVSKIHLTSCSFQPLTSRECYKKEIKLELVLNLIEKYCGDGNVKSLTIGKFHSITALQPNSSFWKDLRVLQLTNFEMCEQELENVLENCHKLIRLELEVLEDAHTDSVYNENGIESIANKITGLCLFKLGKSIKSVKLTTCPDLQLNYLCQFFEHNRQLERFLYTRHRQSPIGIILYGQISKRLRNLRHLTIGTLNDVENVHFHSNIIEIQNLNSLAQLRRLTKLMFDASGHDVSPLIIQLAQSKRLEELTLRNAHISDQFMHSPIQFSSMKVLKVLFKNVKAFDPAYLDNLSKIAYFPNLIELHLEYGNADHSVQVVDLVESGLLTLIVNTPLLEKLFIRIAKFRMNVFHYVAMMDFCRKRDPGKKLCIYLARVNLTQALIQYLQVNQSNNGHLIELRPVYYNLG